MKRIGLIVHLSRILLALCALSTAAWPQSFITTTVQGTVYAAGGAPVSGTLQLSWPAFTTAAGQAIAAGRTTVNIGADGALSVSLAPNIGAMPAGLYYTAVYHLADGTTSTEYWVVPAAAQATLSQVRAQVMPAAQAVQAVSKAYVDQTVQQAVQGQVTVFGGTLTGPLFLPGDPTQPSQAADKHYVDGAVSGALPLGGGVLQGPLTGPQIGADYQADQFKGSDFGAQLQACVHGLNANYGGTCDARNFTGALTMAANLTIGTANATLYLPCSTIATTASIVVPAGTRNVTLHGCATRGTSAASGSQGGTVILYSGTGAAIEVGDPTYAADTQGFHLDNIAVNTTAAASSTAQALAIERTQELTLQGLYLLGNANQTGITLDGTGNYTGGSFEDVHLSGFQTAINAIGHQVSNAATTDWLNASTFVRLHIDCPTANGNPIAGTTGINLQQGDGNTFTGGDVEGCATALHLGASAQNNTLVGLRNENSTSQVVADAGSSYNNWITGGTMFTGKLTDNGTRNSFLDTFHRSFNSLNGDWYGSQQDATVTNHYRLGIGSGNERGLYNRYQTDSGYRWTTGLSDATAGEQYFQILDELNSVYRLSIGQYNTGQPSTNNQTVINAAGTGAVVLNGSNNAGTGGVVIGSGGAANSTVATISNNGNAQFTGTLQVGGTAQSAGTLTVRNNADAEVDYYLWPGLTASQKGSFTYKDFNGNSQWYLVKDASNNWAPNSAVGGLDSFKAYQSTNSGDTYVNAANTSGTVRINYESGSGAAFNIYGGNSSALYAGFSGTTSIKFPGLAAATGQNCMQIDNSGWLSNAGFSCGTAKSVAASGLTFSDSSVQTTSQQGALTGAANDATARASVTAEATRAEAAESAAQALANTAQAAASTAQAVANTAQTAANAALPANGATSTGTGSANVAAFPGSITAGASVTAPQIGPFYVASLEPGADCGARIAAADAALGSTHGEIWLDQACNALGWSTPITLRSNHTLRCAQGGTYNIGAVVSLGQGDTVVGPPKSSPTGQCVFQETNGSNLPAIFHMLSSGVTLSNISVDGNKSGSSQSPTTCAAQGGCHGVWVDSSNRITISAVDIQNAVTDNLHITQTAFSSCCGRIVEHSYIGNAGGDNVFCSGGAADWIVETTEFEGAAKWGIEAPGCATWRISDSDVGGNGTNGTPGTAGGIRIAGVAGSPAYGWQINGTQFGNQLGPDIWCDGSGGPQFYAGGNIIVGNNFFGLASILGGGAPDNTYDSIHELDCGGSTVTGNNFGGTSPHRYRYDLWHGTSAWPAIGGTVAGNTVSNGSNGTSWAQLLTADTCGGGNVGGFAPMCNAILYDQQSMWGQDGQKSNWPMLNVNNGGASLLGSGHVTVNHFAQLHANTAQANADLIAYSLVEPPAPTGTPSGSGGTVAAGIYYAKMVAVDPQGHTVAGYYESAPVTTTGSTASIAWSWTCVARASSYQLWVGTTSGAENSYFAVSGCSYTQTATTGTAGTMPTGNNSHWIVLPNYGTGVLQTDGSGNVSTSGGLPVKYTPSLTPAAAPVSGCAEQGFSVAGVTTNQAILSANAPSNMGAHIWIGGKRVSATGVVAIEFCGDATSGTPPSGAWTITAY